MDYSMRYTIGSILSSQDSGSALLNKITAWYELNEAAGTTLVEEKGLHTGYIGTSVSVNQVAPGPGAIGHYFSAVDNYPESHDDITHHANLSIGSSYAMAVWFNIEDLVAERFIAAKRYEWHLSVNTSGVLRFRQRHLGLTTYNEWTFGTISAATNYHAIINVLNSQDRYSGCEIWINGVSQTVGSSNNPDTLNQSTESLSIGLSPGFGYMKGTIGQFAQFNNSLTSGEVAQLWNGGSGVTYAALNI